MPNSLRRSLGLRFVSLCLLFMSSPPLLAADIETLARDGEWLALLHYARDGGARDGGGDYRAHSYVDDARFFLSKAGARDALAELRASIAQLTSDPQLRCRFVGRYQWLQRRALVPADAAALAHCDEYWQWRETVNAESVVLVFAASYLNSPSSMYGHTFLRFDPGGERGESPLLSFALNFGANVPPRDNSLLFAYRGLAGGYPGLFTMQPYYEKVQEYTRLENRDIWEYRLNLDAAELDRLLAHVWELRGINFDYYFFDENCSFRLLELLEVARPGTDLSSGFDLHAIPVDTVRAVADAGMIDAVNYRPSRQVELQQLLDQLDGAGQRLARQLARNSAQASDPRFQTLPPAQQRLVVLAAYRHLRYRHNRDGRDPAVARRSLALLRQLRELPGEVAGETPPRPLRPDRGHHSTMATLSLGAEEDRDLAELELRIAYHDLLDWRAGYPEGASLNMGRLLLRAAEGESPQLQRLDIIEITSLAPRSRFFRPLSWRVNFGAERQFTGADEPLAAQVNGGVGGSWSLAGINPYLLATVRLEHNPGFAHNWQPALGAATGLLLQRDWGALQLGAEHYRFEDGVDRQEYLVALQKRLASNHGLRLSWRRRLHDDVEREAAILSWRYHF